MKFRPYRSTWEIGGLGDVVKDSRFLLNGISCPCYTRAIRAICCAPPEGAQQPSGLELTSFLPHSHVLPASSALCLALCMPCSTSQSLPLADKRIYSGRVDAQAAAAAAAGAIARVLGPCGRQQRRSAACFRLSFFGCDRHGVNRCVTAFGGAPGGVPRPGCGRGVHMGRIM